MHRVLLLVSLIMPWAVVAQDYDALIRDALELRNNGQLVAAESKFREAYRIAGDKREAAYLLGLVLAYQEKFDEAMRVLDEALLSYPGSTDLIITRARVLSYQERFVDALEIVDGVLAREPDNTDALNLAGRIAIYRQQPEKSRTRFLEVLALDPENLEAVVGLHDAALALGDDERAGYYLDLAEGIAPANADVRQRRSRRSASPDLPRHEILAGFGVSRFDLAGFSRWRDRFVEYRHGAAGEDQQFLHLAHAHRFGVHDSLWEIGAIVNSANRMPVEVAVGMGSNERFLPRMKFRVGVGFDLHQGSEHFGASVGRLTLRRARYVSGTTRQVFFDVEHYFVGTNGWVTPGIGVTRDETGNSTFSWKIGLNHHVSPRWRWGIAWIDAPETENNVTTDTETLHVYARCRVSRAVAFRLDYARNDRLGSYTRSSLDVTLSYRF